MACSQSLQPAPSHCTVGLNRRQWSKLKCHKQCLKSRQMVICNLLFIICNMIFTIKSAWQCFTTSLAIVTKKLCILFKFAWHDFPLCIGSQCGATQVGRRLRVGCSDQSWWYYYKYITTPPTPPSHTGGPPAWHHCRSCTCTEYRMSNYEELK